MTIIETVDEAARSVKGAAGVLNSLASMAESSVITPQELEFVADGLRQVQEMLDACLASHQQEADLAPEPHPSQPRRVS